MQLKLPHICVLALAIGALGWNIGRASAEQTTAAERGAVLESAQRTGADQPTPSTAAVGNEADALQGGSCGDYQCNPPEDCHSCPSDCGDCCGNNRCEPPEDGDSCPADCG